MKQNKLWRFLNSRFISISIMPVVFFLVIMIFFSIMFRGHEEKKRISRSIETIPHLQILEINEADTEPNTQQKFVGTIRNNSPNLLTSIKGAICFYDSNNMLIDVIIDELKGVDNLEPKAEGQFYVLREIPRGGTGATPTLVKENTDRIEFRFLNVSIIKY